jgi:hypothetical protein
MQRNLRCHRLIAPIVVCTLSNLVIALLLKEKVSNI